MAIIVIEVINFFIGAAIFTIGYSISQTLFKEQDSVIESKTAKDFFGPIKWISVSFLFLALHELMIILSDLKLGGVDYLPFYLVSEFLFVGSIALAVYQFQKINPVQRQLMSK